MKTVAGWGFSIPVKDKDDSFNESIKKLFSFYAKSNPAEVFSLEDFIKKVGVKAESEGAFISLEGDFLLGDTSIVVLSKESVIYSNDDGVFYDTGVFPAVVFDNTETIALSQYCDILEIERSGLGILFFSSVGKPL